MDPSGISRESLTIGCALTLAISASFSMLQLMRRPRYPGPLLAKITKWWLRWHELRNDREKFIESLHKRYGAFVQIAPKEVSVSSADGLRDIFAVTRRLDRADPLPLLHLYRSENLVSTESGELHQQRRRPLRSVYTARTVEGEHMQAVFKTLLGRVVRFIDDRSAGGEPVDVVHLGRIYAADVGSHVVYGSENSLNLLGDEAQGREFGRDVEWSEQRLLTLWSLVVFWYPNFAVWLERKGIAPRLMPGSVPGDLVMNQKGREVLANLLSGNSKRSDQRPDTLTERVVSEYKEHGPSRAVPNEQYILSETLDHFWAGIQTLNDAIAATFYQLSHPQNRSRQVKLRDELRNAGIRSSEDISLSVVKGLEYLDFVIRETLRHSSPIPFTLSRRVTAEEGMDVLGHWVPPGMVIGAQPYSVHRNMEAFSDAETWNPERWEVSKEPEKFRCMKRHSFAFGAGPRMCVGMNVALAELKLLLAQVYSTYETQLSPEWFLENGEIRPEDDRGHLWPSKSKPWKRHEPILFRRL